MLQICNIKLYKYKIERMVLIIIMKSMISNYRTVIIV